MYNLEIIRKTWTHYQYFIIVSFNGKDAGHELPLQVFKFADKVILCSQNAGHLQGNSQLILQAIDYIPDDCANTILLEADTWLYKDKLIEKYARKINKKTVWASAKWYDRHYSLATDFALVNSHFIKNNRQIFDFGISAETNVANYIISKEYEYIYIKENMPVMLPSYIKKYPYAPRGRFFVFPSSRMVTHHTELYKHGIQKKIRDFNILSNNFFSSTPVKYRKLKLIWMKICFFSSYIFLRRSWYSKNTQLYT